MLTSLNVHGYSVDVLCNMQSTAAGFNQIKTFCRLNTELPKHSEGGVGLLAIKGSQIPGLDIIRPAHPCQGPWCSIDELLKALLSFSAPSSSTISVISEMQQMWPQPLTQRPDWNFFDKSSAFNWTTFALLVLGMIETFQVDRVILFNNPAISLKMFVCLQGQKMDVWQDDLESDLCALCLNVG